MGRACGGARQILTSIPPFLYPLPPTPPVSFLLLIAFSPFSTTTRTAWCHPLFFSPPRPSPRPLPANIYSAPETCPYYPPETASTRESEFIILGACVCKSELVWPPALTLFSLSHPQFRSWPCRTLSFSASPHAAHTPIKSMGDSPPPRRQGSVRLEFAPGDVAASVVPLPAALARRLSDGGAGGSMPAPPTSAKLAAADARRRVSGRERGIEGNWGAGGSRMASAQAHFCPEGHVPLRVHPKWGVQTGDAVNAFWS